MHPRCSRRIRRRMLQLTGGAFGRRLRASIQYVVQAMIKEVAMDLNNRVLGRMGARELTEQEVDAVQGAFQVRHTLTLCFIDKQKQFLNGDQAIGECGP